MPIRNEHFRHLDTLKNGLDRLFSEAQGGFGFLNEFSTARTDVYETEDEVVAHCEIPGLDKQEDVSIHVEDDVLTLQGIVLRNSDISEEHMHRKERFSGRFQRHIPLPARVSVEGTKASYRSGILEVRMPKLKRDSAKRVDVEFH